MPRAVLQVFCPFRCRSPDIHAKQYLFDGIASFIGSYNIEEHAAEINHESGIICMDKTLNEELKNQFTIDLINSVPAVSKNNQ